MANRLLSNRIYSQEKDRKIVNIKATGTGNGTVPTLDAANSKGVLSITRQGAGLYDIAFGTVGNGLNVPDTYVKFLALHLALGTASFAAATSTIGYYIVPASNFISTTGVMRIQLLSATNTAVDPASGDIVYLQFEFGDSTAP